MYHNQNFTVMIESKKSLRVRLNILSKIKGIYAPYHFYIILIVKIHYPPPQPKRIFFFKENNFIDLDYQHINKNIIQIH